LWPERPLSHCQATNGMRCHDSTQRPMTTRLLALLCAFLLGFAGPACAQDVAAFYHGKQMRFIVGSAVGGGYDLFARIVARHIVNYTPGNANIIVQNQTAPGGVVMINQLFALGPKDGNVVGIPINGIPTAPLL